MNVYRKIAGGLVILGIVIFTYGNFFYAIGDYGVSAPGWVGIGLALAGIGVWLYAQFDRYQHRGEPTWTRNRSMRPPGGR